jgi:hypothetical protein
MLLLAGPHLVASIQLSHSTPSTCCSRPVKPRLSNTPAGLLCALYLSLLAFLPMPVTLCSWSLFLAQPHPPSHSHHQEYIVTLAQPATKQQIATMAAGTEVQGVHVKPLLVEVVQRGGPSSSSSSSSGGSGGASSSSEAGGDRMRLRVVVAEGRKHEVSPSSVCWTYMQSSWAACI